MPQRDIADVLAEQTPNLLSLDGVAIVYQSVLEDGRACIKVGVRRDTEELRAHIPEEIEGYPVVLVNTGPIGLHDDDN